MNFRRAALKRLDCNSLSAVAHDAAGSHAASCEGLVHADAHLNANSQQQDGVLTTALKDQNDTAIGFAPSQDSSSCRDHLGQLHNSTNAETPHTKRVDRTLVREACQQANRKLWNADDHSACSPDEGFQAYALQLEPLLVDTRPAKRGRWSDASGEIVNDLLSSDFSQLALPYYIFSECSEREDGLKKKKLVLKRTPPGQQDVTITLWSHPETWDALDQWVNLLRLNADPLLKFKEHAVDGKSGIQHMVDSLRPHSVRILYKAQGEDDYEQHCGPLALFHLFHSRYHTRNIYSELLIVGIHNKGHNWQQERRHIVSAGDQIYVYTTTYMPSGTSRPASLEPVKPSKQNTYTLILHASDPDQSEPDQSEPDQCGRLPSIRIPLHVSPGSYYLHPSDPQDPMLVVIQPWYQ